MVFASHLPKWGRKVLAKKSVVAGQEILISRRSSIIKRVNFVKKAQRIFGENKTLHVCIVIYN